VARSGSDLGSSGAYLLDLGCQSFRFSGLWRVLVPIPSPDNSLMVAAIAFCLAVAFEGSPSVDSR